MLALLSSTNIWYYLCFKAFFPFVHPKIWLCLAHCYTLWEVQHILNVSGQSVNGNGCGKRKFHEGDMFGGTKFYS